MLSFRGPRCHEAANTVHAIKRSNPSRIAKPHLLFDASI
jgi:hypothetical protein